MAEDDLSQLKKLVGLKRLVIGTHRTIKGLKQGKIERVYLSSNIPKMVKEDIEHYAKLSKETKVVQLDIPNDEVGILVKKPFSISVIGVLRS